MRKKNQIHPYHSLNKNLINFMESSFVDQLSFSLLEDSIIASESTDYDHLKDPCEYDDKGFPSMKRKEELAESFASEFSFMQSEIEEETEKEEEGRGVFCCENNDNNITYQNNIKGEGREYLINSQIFYSIECNLFFSFV